MPYFSELLEVFCAAFGARFAPHYWGVLWSLMVLFMSAFRRLTSDSYAHSLWGTLNLYSCCPANLGLLTNGVIGPRSVLGTGRLSSVRD